MDCLTLSAFLEKYDLEEIIEPLNNQKFLTLDDLRLIKKFPFYVEKLGLPGLDALRLLDAVNSHFKEPSLPTPQLSPPPRSFNSMPQSSPLLPRMSPTSSSTSTPQSSPPQSSPPPSRLSPVSSSELKTPSSTPTSSSISTPTSELGRILKKGKLLKIKSFVAQEANSLWNEFNNALSSLVNERIDEFKGSKSLRCNHGTNPEEAFHNTKIVMEITRDPSLKTFMDRKINIPNHGYVAFDTKMVRMFCGNKLTHQRKKSEPKKKQMFVNSKTNDVTNQEKNVHEDDPQSGDDDQSSSSLPNDDNSMDEAHYGCDTHTEKGDNSMNGALTNCITDKLNKDQATTVVLKYFKAKRLGAVQTNELKSTISELGLVTDTKIKADMANVLGCYLFTKQIVQKVDPQKGVTLSNLERK